MTDSKLTPHQGIVWHRMATTEARSLAKSGMRKRRGRKKKASAYRGLTRKRVNGLEPSTFTLAT